MAVDGAVGMAVDGAVGMAVGMGVDGDNPITILLIMVTLVAGLETGSEEIEHTVLPIILMVFHHLVGHLHHHHHHRHQAVDLVRHQVGSSDYQF
jgi:hypothetical protein